MPRPGAARATQDDGDDQIVRYRPVLKWAGGKRQLLGEILRRLPDELAIDTYYEPFVGGGAVFFALAERRKFKRAVLADSNRDLIDVYGALQGDVEALIARLETMAHTEDAFYRIRAERPRSQLHRAARVIYLNKTGYNGLYRVNSKGEFNVPFGRYKRPNICDKKRLRAAAAALRGVKLEIEDFETVCNKARAGDFVYLDPPYLPVSRTSSFAAYHRDPFGVEEHRRLASVFARLRERGVRALLSNSDTPETRQIFADFAIDTVHAARAINSNAARRGTINEILVSSLEGRRSRARAR